MPKEFLKIDDAITAIYITKCSSYECECIEKLLEGNNEIFFLCVYQDFMPNVGTYYNICDVEQRKKSYCHAHNVSDTLWGKKDMWIECIVGTGDRSILEPFQE